MPDITPTVMLSAEEIQARIASLAAEISRDYPADEEIHLVAILKGAFLFLGDLIRAMRAHGDDRLHGGVQLRQGDARRPARCG